MMIESCLWNDIAAHGYQKCRLKVPFDRYILDILSLKIVSKLIPFISIISEKKMESESVDWEQLTYSNLTYSAHKQKKRIVHLVQVQVWSQLAQYSSNKSITSTSCVNTVNSNTRNSTLKLLHGSERRNN